jgi:hypothetical protein
MGVAGVAAAAIGIRAVFVVAGLIAGVAGLLAWLMLRDTEDRQREPMQEPA